VLHVAARARKPDVIDLVLSRLACLETGTVKAFINQKSAEGDTALHYACRVDRLESVDLLLNAGADPGLPGKYGYTPLSACADFEVEQARQREIVGKDDAQRGKRDKKSKRGKMDTTKARRTGSIFIRDHGLTADELEECKRRTYGMEQGPDSSRLDGVYSLWFVTGQTPPAMKTPFARHSTTLYSTNANIPSNVCLDCSLDFFPI
jgi:hypothetical protein